MESQLEKQLEREKKAAALFEGISTDSSLVSWHDRLASAVIRGDLQQVKHALSHDFSHADLSALDSEGQTLLHWAALYNEPLILQLLLDAGASPFVANRKHALPLHQAALASSHAVLRILLSRPHAASPSTPSLRATPAPSPSVAFSYHALNQWRETPLHLAAQVGDPLSVLLLVRHGARIDAQDQWGRTPPQVAADHGECQLNDLFALLLEANHASQEQMQHVAGHLIQKYEQSGKLSLGIAPTQHTFINTLPDQEISSSSSSSSSSSFSSKMEKSDEVSSIDDVVFSTSSSSTLSSTSTPISSSTSTLISTSSSTSSSPPRILSKMMEAPLDEARFSTLLHRSELPADHPEFLALDVTSPDMYGLRPLHKLASWDRTSAISQLLQHSAFPSTDNTNDNDTINANDNDAESSLRWHKLLFTHKQESPLILALEMGALHAARMLLDHPVLSRLLADHATLEGVTPCMLATSLLCSRSANDEALAAQIWTELAERTEAPEKAVQIAIRFEMMETNNHNNNTTCSAVIAKLIERIPDGDAQLSSMRATVQAEVQAQLEAEQARRRPQPRRLQISSQNIILPK